MIELRLGTDGEAAEIAVMSRDLIEYGLRWSWTEPRVRRHVADPETVVLVAGAGAQRHLAGFAIMQFAEEHAHLNLLAVRPAYRRRGVGRGLIDWLEESARVAGLGTVFLEVRTRNAGARRFYRRLGYRELAYLPGYYAPRESGIRMIRDLAWELPHSESSQDLGEV